MTDLYKKIDEFIVDETKTSFIDDMLLVEDHKNIDVLSCVRYLFLLGLWRYRDPLWGKVLTKFYAHNPTIERYDSKKYIELTSKKISIHWGQETLQTILNDQIRQEKENAAKVATIKKSYDQKNKTKKSKKASSDTFEDDEVIPSKKLSKKGNITDSMDLSLANDALKKAIQKQRGE